MIGGLFLIYLVGKAFYGLAHEYDKSPWGFAILGVASYYIGLLLGGVLIGIGGEIIAPGFLDDVSDILLGLMCVPFGVLACWLTYKLLTRSWSKPKNVEMHTLDGGFINTGAGIKDNE